MKQYISKSDYCDALGCMKMLWLEKNKPEVFDRSAINQSSLENGIMVGNVAKGIFGPYVEVPLSPNYVWMANKTSELMDAGTPVICEASFISDDLFCRVDILRNLGSGSVELYEVKAENSLKDINYDDAAFQAYVLRNAGIDVRRVCLVYLNRDYERNGDLDLAELFCIEDVTAQVNSMAVNVPANVAAMKSALSKDETSFREIMPECMTGDCGFWPYCTRALPQPNVFSLNGTRVKKQTKFKLYDSGIVSYPDIFRQGGLKDTQARQVDVFLSGRPYIDVAGIRDTLDQLSYPLYFLDFETYNVPIPPYDHIRPFMQVPFQYSLHYIEHEGGELNHKEFLARAGEDSRRELAERLCEDIPADACVTAYFKPFECGRLKEMADLFPDLSAHLLAIRDNVVDLETPFKQQYYVLPAMKGKSTIKLVLPALFPDDPALDYTSLEGVHKGTEASAAFLAMADMSAEEQAVVRKQLLDYCGLDTLAMVKVWERLREAAGD
jgi:hypothetical protein